MKNKENKKILLLIIVIIILALAIIGICMTIFLQIKDSDNTPIDTGVDNTPQTQSSDNQTQDTEEVLPDNPIDFENLQAENEDLYAWITVPNTEIDYVIAQAGDNRNDLFYLTHNMYGEYEFAGTIYSEKQNAKDFSDPVTVLYGHKMLNGSMFAGLVNFKDEDFFNENKYFYIYTPGHILTYEIFSAYVYDNRHILNTFDFSDTEIFREYLDYACDSSLNNGNVRTDADVTIDDNIVVLSTCANGGTDRYLVQGVLTNDEKTK